MGTARSRGSPVQRVHHRREPVHRGQFLNNLETVKAEHAAEEMHEPDADDELLRRVEAIHSEMGELETRLRARVDTIA